jgi:hypothetical protein
MRACSLRWRRGRGRLEAASLVVARIVADAKTTAGSQRPATCVDDDSTPRWKASELAMQTRTCCPGNLGIEKLETRGASLFRRLRCSAKAPLSVERRISSLLRRIATIFPVDRISVCVALRLYPFKHPLIQPREFCAHFFCRKAKAVDHFHAARLVGQVAAVAVWLYWCIRLQSARLLRSENQPGAMWETASCTEHSVRTQSLALPRCLPQSANLHAASPCSASVTAKPSPVAFALLGHGEQRPIAAPAAPTVMAMRTAAPSALSTHG